MKGDVIESDVERYRYREKERGRERNVEDEKDRIDRQKDRETER